MDLTNHAKGSNHIVTYLDGHPVYSLIDIMDKVDKYGYKNNIICGFNCRHKLIPYKKGVYGPKEYSEEDVAKEREIDQKMRAMEREIRKLKEQIILLEKTGLKKDATTLKKRVNILIDNYKKFCESNGYPWYEYRINVM